ncbi:MULTISPECIES: general stress protein [unclassified Phyllobacterium]|uniref:general stress protein n=1 Tax=unclassified Phyllobacterium TaxID=2638441 RepID=UPI00301317E6
MQTVTGLYDNYSDAKTAVNALEDAGISSSDISIIGRDGEEHDSNAGEGTAAGAGVGAVVGGTGGLLAGLGMLAIPGVGPVVAAGWLAATAAGAVAGAAAGGAAGGIIGSLITSGVDEDDAHVYAEGVRRGSTLVSARVEDEHVDAARAILSDDSAVDVKARRGVYREEGWERFDENAPEYTDDDVLKERDRLRQTRDLMP